MGETDGFIRLVIEKETGDLLGTQMVDSNACEYISEITMAIECGSTVEDVALTIHPHPSLSEAVMDTADVAIGFPTNI